jgi:hypothetical protein
VGVKSCPALVACAPYEPVMEKIGSRAASAIPMRAVAAAYARSAC